MSDNDSRNSISGHLFTLGGGAVSWKTIKQKYIADSITEGEYIAAYEDAKKAVWLKKFLIELKVVPMLLSPITLYCDNSGAVAQSKEPRNHGMGKYRAKVSKDIVQRGDVTVTKNATIDNLADPFTKAFPSKVLDRKSTRLNSSH